MSKMLRLSAAFFCCVLTHLAFSQTIDNCPANVPRDRFLQVHGDSCYQFVTNRHITHNAAKSDCGRRGGTLALVKTPDIQAYLVHELTHTYNYHTSKFWIGLNDIDKENVYKWEDGSPLSYTAWAQGEGPGATSAYHQENHNENDCVTIDLEYGGKWLEYPCEETTFFFFFSESEEHYYICQYKLSAGATTVFTTSPPVTATTAAPGTDSTVVSETAPLAITAAPETTVTSISNACPAFTCDLDCGMDGFKKDAETGCSQCACDV
ncbi:unnamed protein product [Lymnaea stagnalis]|uniref:C-type lectin domain-containing protein n=1 Tax=Lymnaea stagnalis TaxID=6523 RepID=A0AAV2H0B7_LYMST